MLAPNVIILAGFAVQRVLMDVIAGTMMFVERWYAVGPRASRRGALELSR
jgi:hypothetical protein